MTTSAEIVFQSLLPSSEPLKISSHDAYLVDDLIQRACELASIPPVFKYLCALFDLEHGAYLEPNQTIGGDGLSHKVQLRIRFHPYSLDSIMGSSTMNYYYHQLHDFLLHGYKMKEQNIDLINRLIGLVVTDYVRELLEKGEQPDEEKTVSDMISSSFPANWKFSWWKKPIVKKDFIQKVQTCYENSKQDKTFIKCGYIEEIWELLKECRQEIFESHILVNGAFYACSLVVGHLGGTEGNNSKEGPFIKIVCSEETHILFPISHLCYLNVVKFEQSSVVEVHVREEQPISLRFDVEEKAVEFLTLLDGYFRMTERFLTCLCGQVQNPSIIELKKRKIHGPINQSFAIAKLKDVKNRQGCFLIRQNAMLYRMYIVDVLLADGMIQSHSIAETVDGNFRLQRDPEENAFQSISALVTSRLTSGKQLYHVPPSDYDKTGLQFCKAPTENIAREEEDEGKILSLKKIKIDKADLRITAQQRVSKGVYKNREVVLRSVHDERCWKSFLTKADEIKSWRSREIVPILGIIVVSPVSLVMDFMPMGALDVFIKERGKELTIGDLGDASLCLAKAVWFLEEQGFVHGRIRCRSAFVVECERYSFKVKLGDPGLLHYTEEDVHWIAPEYLSVMDSVAYSQKADLYALGTTMWEIFNKARNPSDIISIEEARPFYASGKRLSLVEVPQEFCAIVADCWDKDPDKRRPPHSIVRDIHQLLYQIYQPKKYNTYAYLGIRSSKPRDSPEAPTLPPLRTSNSRLKEKGTNLQRRESSVSQSSIASRKLWKNNPVMNLFRPQKQKEYDELSNVSSLAPSEVTVTTAINDARGVGNAEQNPYLVSLDGDHEYVPEEDEEDCVDDQDWIIERMDLKLGNILGQGFYGMVFKGTLVRYSGILEEPVAVKRLKSSVSEYSHKDLEREIDIMKKLRHPNIVEIKGMVQDPEILLVMEFLELGSLATYLKCNAQNISHSQLIKYSLDIADAMSYLESKKIIHRDLAARNILVKSETCVKISDFGLAHAVNNYYMIQTMHRQLPTKWYAPESILYGKFSIKSDVWSYGVAIWEMFSYGEDPMLTECQNQNALGDMLASGLRLQCPPDCPPDIYQVMRDCWRTDYALRPTFVSLRETMRHLVETTG